LLVAAVLMNCRAPRARVLTITEIMYHPADGDPALKFVEIGGRPTRST
jgi:hypothetical protein